MWSTTVQVTVTVAMPTEEFGEKLRERPNYPGKTLMAGSWVLKIQLVCGTWVGADDPVVHFRSTALGQGANMALPIYGFIHETVYSDPTLGIDPNASSRDMRARKPLN